MAALAEEIARRRTFAIISHPDAGKTTLTEKMLLFGGAIHLAGAVKSRRAARTATSDWMDIEKQRGISVTTSAMMFPYHGYQFNLLDTPGHEDFSEDTYRTICAADSAIMLVDSAKGVEAQTRKLFQVCRLREMPIFTFVNKMDREGREPLDLMHEIEQLLGIHCVPVNWPIGQGPRFRGVYDRLSRIVHVFERDTSHGEKRTSFESMPFESPRLAEYLDASERKALADDIELLDHAGESFDRAKFLSGDITPVFFGSALTNFGVEPFLQVYGELAPPPGPRHSSTGMREATAEKFSGFIFKIQANMDKSHRDRIAFLRVVSGRFERGMDVWHVRAGRRIKLSNSISFFAQERQLVEEGYPGDIIGLYDPGVFQIADTLTEGESFQFEGIPRFCPELFCRVLAPNPLKRKRLSKGLQQLAEEGTIQVLAIPGRGEAEPVLAAVGRLQFEVVQHRLLSEYDVEVKLDPLGYSAARWLDAPKGYDWHLLERQGISAVFEDGHGRFLVAFRDEWSLQYAIKNSPGIAFREAAPAVVE